MDLSNYTPLASTYQDREKLDPDVYYLNDFILGILRESVRVIYGDDIDPEEVYDDQVYGSQGRLIFEYRIQVDSYDVQDNTSYVDDLDINEVCKSREELIKVFLDLLPFQIESKGDRYPVVSISDTAMKPRIYPYSNGGDLTQNYDILVHVLVIPARIGKGARSF